jgi:hypothetical protein
MGYSFLIPQGGSIMKRARKLRLNKETLSRMDAQGSTLGGGFDSCIDSCYLVSCEGGCTISTGQTSD